MFFKHHIISYTELFDTSKYKLVEEINYSNIVSFIYPYLKPREWIMYSFYIFLFILGFLWGYYSVELLLNKVFSIWKLLGNTLFWISLPFLIIIPVHELIHGFAFKLMGAQKLKFGANFHELVFYVTCDKFVLNKNMFIFLALAPFCIFTIFFACLLFSPSLVVQWIGAMLLFLHTSCCIGDITLISYTAINAPKTGFYTFDDISTKTSYFFIKIPDS